MQALNDGTITEVTTDDTTDFVVKDGLSADDLDAFLLQERQAAADREKVTARVTAERVLTEDTEAAQVLLKPHVTRARETTRHRAVLTACAVIVLLAVMALIAVSAPSVQARLHTDVVVTNESGTVLLPADTAP